MLWSPFQGVNPAFCDPENPVCTNASRDGGADATDAGVADAAASDAGFDAAGGGGEQDSDMPCNPGPVGVWTTEPLLPEADVVTLTGITGNGNGDIWAVGNPGYAAHRVSSWSRLSISGVGPLGRVAYSPRQNQALVLTTNLVGSAVMHLTSAGMGTTDTVNLLARQPTGIWVSGFPERLPYLVGADSTFKSYSNGFSWADVVFTGASTPVVLNAISGSGMDAATIVWGVSATANRLAAFSAASATWQSIDTGSRSLNALWVSPISGVVAVGQGGAIMSAPATLPIKAPVTMGSPVTANLTDVAGTTTGNQLWTVGDGGTILYWESTCKKWIRETGVTQSDLKALWVSDSEKRVWAVGTRGTVVSRAIP